MLCSDVEVVVNLDWELLRACAAADAAACEAALNAGAKIGRRDALGWTAMHHACAHWRALYPLAPRLLHAGGNIWIEDNEGVTPLDLLLEPDEENFGAQ